MNCEEFVRRLYRHLDDRTPPGQDAVLRQHAEGCSHCDETLRAWESIATVVGPAEAESARRMFGRGQGSRDRRIRRTRRPAVWATGLAAAFALAVISIAARQDHDSGQYPGDPRPAATVGGAHVESAGVPSRGVLAQDRPSLGRPLAADVDPTRWWQDVRSRDWISKTMPAVRSLQEGVAPLGRSLMRAVTILTIAGNDKTS